MTGTLEGIRGKHALRIFIPLLVLLSSSFGCGGVIDSASKTPAAPVVSVVVTGLSQVRLGATAQLTATVTNASNPAVTWQVGGVTGGSATWGTISSDGLYTPPSTLPTPNTVAISAVSQASPSVSGSFQEEVLNPLPVVSSANANGVGSDYTVTVAGTGFVGGSTLSINGTKANITSLSATQIVATVALSLPDVATAVPVTVTNPDPGSTTSAPVNATVTDVQATFASAARLLDQATFGPTMPDIQNVQNIGLSAYLKAQFQTPPTTLALLPTPPPAICASSYESCIWSEWWQATLTAPDQLRQRVALALAEMFVVSINSVDARAVVAFQNTLANDALTNFSTIMKDVTLSPAMGAYLNMLNSGKPATVNGVPQIANENYGREMMQLFTMGLDLLNPDGTLQLDSNGNPIPTYTQAQVQAFARAYTGWTYATATGGSPAKFPNGTPNFTMPMVAVESVHDENAKILLNGTTLPAGQTAEEDLAGALQNIFEHPNVGPFVCRQLIQHLVSSNPSPAYVGRVAAVFADNGKGVRGDMQAVVTAILLDPEARAGDTDPAAPGGHLREPILWMADVMRGLGFTNNDAVAGNDVVANASYWIVTYYTGPLGQSPYASSSVFNFFPPDYVLPGGTGTAPEFSLENTSTATLRLSLANSIVFNRISGFRVDLSATSPLGKIAPNAGTLVDTLGQMFMHGQMSADMRSAIVNHISTITDPAERVRVATFLVITSSQYKVQH